MRGIVEVTDDGVLLLRSLVSLEPRGTHTDGACENSLINELKMCVPVEGPKHRRGLAGGECVMKPALPHSCCLTLNEFPSV